MRLSIKFKQVAGVTAIVTIAVVVVSAIYLYSLLRVRLEESQARGDLLAGAIYQRAHAVLDENLEARDPQEALQTDVGLRSILEASAYDKRVTYAAIADADGIAIVHSDADNVGKELPSYESLASLLERGPLAQIRAILALTSDPFASAFPRCSSATTSTSRFVTPPWSSPSPWAAPFWSQCCSRRW
jgi:hypothetical protein